MIVSKTRGMEFVLTIQIVLLYILYIASDKTYHE